MEVAVNTPFEANEIKDIAVAEFRARLDQLGPIQGSKEYARFELDFNVNIRVFRVGETGAGKETLAWGHIEKGDKAPDLIAQQGEVSGSKFVSQDPNEERQAQGMALTVETTDGKGGKTRKKVHVKG